MIEFQRKKAFKEELAIAPLLDIIFLLLLFFLLTSVFMDPGIPVDLAESTTAEFQQDKLNILVSLSSSGELFVQDKALSFGELPAALQALFHTSSTHEVTLKVDEETPFQHYVRLMDILKEVGGDDLVISAEIGD